MKKERDPERYELIDRTFDAALDCLPAERPALLERLCGDDVELLREVEELLHASEAGQDFLARPLDGEAVASVLDGKNVLDGTNVLDGFGEEDPKKLGPYRMVEVLGRGGTAVVHRAIEEGADRVVAVKVIRMAWKKAYSRRFEAEREILSRLEHPGIARFLDGGMTRDDRPYLVMEFVDGQPIHRYCDGARVGIEGRVELIRQVCLAVDHAHDLDIVHRDLKPQNVLVTRDGQPKLLDFGIAKLLDPERFVVDVSRTGTGHVPMTPGYASPEQVDGLVVTRASDVYSLGVLLFELLTGRGPYRFANEWPMPLEVAEAICDQLPQGLAEMFEEISGDTKLAQQVADQRGVENLSALHPYLDALDGVLAIALAKNPAERYPTAVAFADALAQVEPRSEEASFSGFWFSQRIVQQFEKIVQKISSLHRVD